MSRRPPAIVRFETPIFQSHAKVKGSRRFPRRIHGRYDLRLVVGVRIVSIDPIDYR
jgi:hypothetical protein